LRAIGPLGDWDEARALAWWHEFKPQESVDISSQPTSTITVDMGTRAGEQAA
jgi:hypothetical protein